MNLLNKFSVLLLGAIFSFVSCSDEPSDSEPNTNPTTGKKYGITVGVTTSAGDFRYVLSTEDIMQDDVLTPVGAGIDITGKVDDTYGTASAGSYYTPDGAAIYKYSIQNGDVVEKGNTLITTGQDYAAFIMKSDFVDGTLNALSWASSYNEAKGAREKNLFIIDTASMNLKSTKVLSFTIPDNLIPDLDNEGQYIDKSKVQLSPTSFGINNGKIYVGFNFLNPSWGTPDKQVAYVLIADYPSLENSTITSTDKYGNSSGTWFQSQSSFFDENGNYYFTAIKENKYYTLLRIKAGTIVIDTDYVFDLSNYNVYIEGYGGGTFDHHTYIKDGKALLGGCIFDINNKTLVKNLDDEGIGRIQDTHADGVLVEGNYLYTFIKTADSKWYIGQYDADNNEFKRGVQLDGGISRGVRLFTY